MAIDPKDLALLQQIWQGAFDGDPEKGKAAGKGNKKGRIAKSNCIDLHWQQLPYPENTPASQKLLLQLSYLEEQTEKLRQQGQKNIWVIHGHGDGTLCEAVRNWARQSAAVSNFQTGHHPKWKSAATQLFLK